MPAPEQRSAFCKAGGYAEDCSDLSIIVKIGCLNEENKNIERVGGGTGSAHSRGRIWIFRGLALLIPLLCLVVLEIGLRVAGFGYSTAFFKEESRLGARMVVANEKFSSRFFPPEQARWPSAFAFPKDKKPEVCRIFIFGESAAMGDPEPAFGPARYMEVLLRERFPGKQFEVINTGMTAINSHVILPIAHDCAKEHGDIWLIYMGNNEMVGPFGVASHAPPRVAVRFIGLLQHLRLGQALMRFTRSFGTKPQTTASEASQMFIRNRVAPQDSHKEMVYKNFHDNSYDIVKAGLNSGCKVIVSTVSVNLKDCPPFSSEHSKSLSESASAEFKKYFSQGSALREERRFGEAVEKFKQAANIDPQFAELHFVWGESCLQSTNAAAREHFQQACDADALPFRADSRINRIIRNLTNEFRSEFLYLSDAEKTIESRDAGIAGKQMFFEHVHFQFKGSYALGKEWAEQVGQMLPKQAANTGLPSWLTEDECNRRLGLSLWNRVFVLEAVMSRLGQPPFNGQSNHSNRIELLRNEVDLLRQQQSERGAVEKAREDFQAAIQKFPTDPFLHENYARFLQATGYPAEALSEYRKVLEYLTDDFYSLLQCGRLLGEQKHLAEAEMVLRKATSARPFVAAAWFELGNVSAAQEQFPEALSYYERALRLRSSDVAHILCKGKVLSKINRNDEALTQIEKALQIDPTNQMALEYREKLKVAVKLEKR